MTRVISGGRSVDRRLPTPKTSIVAAIPSDEASERERETEDETARGVRRRGG